MSTRPSRFGRRTAALAAAVVTLVALSLVAAVPADAASRVSFAGSRPSWAVSANDAGDPAEDDSVEAEMYLPLRDEAGAEALAAAVSSPSSPQYRHTMSPSAWIARYAPTATASKTLVHYLRSTGVRIVSVPKSREYVVFRGTVDQLESIFDARLKTYNYDGSKLIAPSGAPSLPASIGALVSGVVIDQSRLLTRPDYVLQGTAPAPRTSPVSRMLKDFARSAAPVSPSFLVNAPCSSYIGEFTATVPAAYGGTTVDTINCGYSASQLRSAYGLSTLNSRGINGSGQTVAIIDAYASPTITKDVNSLSANAGEPLLKRGQYRQIVPAAKAFTDQDACGDPSGWQTEQTLDVEAVHGVAPGAKILYVGGSNCGGGIDIATSTIIDNKLANIVSNSFGDSTEDLPADVVAGENALYVQAAGEGIGMYFSTGDDGDLSPLGEDPQPSFPATDPYVTGVGGTSLGIDQDGAISFETGWGDQLDQIVAAPNGTLSYHDPLPGRNFAGGAGGGTSSLFTEPSYQRGVVPTSLSGGYRVSPDISADADPYTGYLVGYRPITNDATLATGAYQTQTAGGTSLAAPLVAAQIAIVQQATRSSIGFANPTLYGLDKIFPSTFRDVGHASPPVALAYDSHVSGNTWLVTLDRDTSLSTATGYDSVTGMGSLTYGLLNLLAAGRH